MMQFYSEDPFVVKTLAAYLMASADGDKPIHIWMEDNWLKVKSGGGMWSAPFLTTPETEDHGVKGMKWFINEDGDIYDYPAEYQREAYPGDNHTPFDSYELAELYLKWH